MQRKEALDFLELSEFASDEEIKTRLTDKQNYFRHLCDTAPNAFLKKLHAENVEKLAFIGKFLNSGAASSQKPPDINSTKTHGSADSNSASALNHSPLVIGWLVRHTENQSSKTYPLFIGKNLVGRSAHPNRNTIIVENDPYVSRVHAMLEVLEDTPLSIVVRDDSQSNEGKPSQNGTFINGNSDRIIKPVRISENDTIQIGNTKFVIRSNNTSIHKIIREVEEEEYMKTVVINML